VPHASRESPRPLRRDAARNRQRILEAADELFRRRGLSASLNDIAHYAGVGVGTVYRHFPDKDQLVEGLFEQRFEELVRRMEEAVADPDAWHGLTSFIRFSTELQASDHAIKDLLTGGHVGLERISRIRARLTPMGEELVRRAHADGQLRQDIEAADLPVIQAMMGPLIDASAELDPDLHRRYLDIMIRGIAAHPEQEPPLSTPPLALGRVDEIMVNVSSARRR
jgi:AcrR family transcriptional regulator